MSDGEGVFSVKNIVSVFMVCVLLIAVWLAGVSGAGAAYAKYSASRRDPTSMWYVFPKWIQPNDKWHDWVGYPETFSNVSAYVPTSVTTTKANSSMKDVTDPAECMLQCAGETDCIGFILNNKSNTCTLYSSMDGLFPAATSNVVYAISGKEPERAYIQNVGKMPPLETPKTLLRGVSLGRNDVKVSSVVQGTGVDAANVIITTADPHGFAADSTVILYNYGTNIVLGPPIGATAGSPYSIPITGRVIPSTTTIMYPGTVSASYNVAITAGEDVARLSGADSVTKTAQSILFTTSAEHGFSVDDPVGITGSTIALFNNVYSVAAVVDPRSFYLDLATVTTAGQMTVTGSVTLTSTFKPFSAKTVMDCASACSSNTACLAFTYNTGTGTMCSQLSRAITGDLVTSAPGTINTYTTEKPTFTSSEQYW